VNGPRAYIMILVVGAVGCSRPAVDFLTPNGPVMVWPKAPDRPRIQFVGQLTGSDDLHPRKTMSQIWNELLYGPSQPTRLVNPYAVAVHGRGNRIAVADTNGAGVHVLDIQKQTYEHKTVFGRPERSFECPVAVTWEKDVLWVADSRLHALVVFDRSGKTRIIGQGVLKRPAGLVYCPDNELCYVTDAGLHSVLAFDSTGQLVHRFGTRGSKPGQFNCPSHIACGPDRTLVVVDSLNFRVQRLGLDGSPLGTFGRKGNASGDLAMPKGVAVSPEGNIWVVDAHFENVQGYTPDGKLLMAFGREGHEPGEFWLPAGICIDTLQRMWVADTYNRRVQVFELLQ